MSALPITATRQEPGTVNYVQYAEDVLGVHAPYEEAQHRLADYEAAGVRHVAALKAIRDQKSRIVDRETELAIEERADNPDMNATAFKEHLRVATIEDAALSAFRDELAALESDRDDVAHEVAVAKLGCQVLSARLIELGGLLHFYAVNKAATAPPSDHDES